jgi:hypothetical protein
MERKSEFTVKDLGRCLLEGYLGCPARIEEACICASLPRSVVIEMAKKKFFPHIDIQGVLDSKLTVC